MKSILAIGLTLVLAASANAEKFIGYLDGFHENAPNVSPGNGTGTATYDPGTQMLTVDLTYSDLLVGATDAHIHCCSTALTTNAGVAIGFTGNGFAIGSTSGTYTHTFDLGLASTYSGGYFSASGGTVALARDRLLNAMRIGVENDPLPGDSSIAYFNIHTNVFPGGEIRGNIVPFVPEPSTAILMLCGIAVSVARRRR